MNLSAKSDLGLTKWIKTFILLLVDLFHFGRFTTTTKENHNTKFARSVEWLRQLIKKARQGEIKMRTATNNKTENRNTIDVEKEFSEILGGIKDLEKDKKTALSDQAHKIRTLRSRCRVVYNVLSKQCREFAGVR